MNHRNDPDTSGLAKVIDFKKAKRALWDLYGFDGVNRGPTEYDERIARESIDAPQFLLVQLHGIAQSPFAVSYTPFPGIYTLKRLQDS